MTASVAARASVALIGARGYVGTELMALIAGHPGLRLSLVSSRELAGQPVPAALGGPVDGDGGGLHYCQLEPEGVAARVASDRPDVWILALPNGLSAPWVAAIDAVSPEAVIVDLSTDHRAASLDPASGWVYGLPERNRPALQGARRVANPGCYATGVQLGLGPILDLLVAAPHAFGVSGYSGAGTTPSPRNDPEALRDNLMPYALTGHAHEAEVRGQLGRTVHFMPHVAPFFRGLALTLSFEVAPGVTRDDLVARYVARYADEPLVRYGEALPLVRDAAGDHGVRLGGLAFEPATGHGAIAVTLDNLLKGAATQALQNVNLALGLPERLGLPGF